MSNAGLIKELRSGLQLYPPVRSGTPAYPLYHARVLEQAAVALEEADEKLEMTDEPA